MKLNKKGYMLVEIIIGFGIAMSIAYYLLTLTYKFKNLSEDIYQTALYTKEKMTITKNIMNDLEKGTIKKDTINKNGQTINFELCRKTFNKTSIRWEETETCEDRKLEITKENGITTIKYGKISQSGAFQTSDVSYYEKEIEKSLVISDMEKTSNNNILFIKIPMQSLYTEGNYDINLYSDIE